MTAGFPGSKMPMSILALYIISMAKTMKTIVNIALQDSFVGKCRFIIRPVLAAMQYKIHIVL